MTEFQKLAQEVRDEQRLKEIEASYGIPLLDTGLIILTIALAILFAIFFVEVFFD